MSLIHVFPGQGSQQQGMGEDLFGRFPELTACADEVLGYSIQVLCVDNPDNRLAQTQYTQPALYTVNALIAEAAADETGARPDMVAGHSLGEYNALLAAGCFDFRLGLVLVRRRGEIMGKIQGGAMAAVIGLAPEAIAAALEAAGLDRVDVANYNAPSQTVISGDREQVEKAGDALDAAGARRVIRLNVSGAFHSRLMDDAAADFDRFLADFKFAAPQIPVIANVTALPYSDGNVRENLSRQICSPVRWTESVRYLLQQPDPEFEEIGPGSVLTGLIRQIRKSP